MLIPVKREEPVITKRSFVKEEIVVKKKPVTETKTVSEEVVNEEMEYVNTTEWMTFYYCCKIILPKSGLSFFVWIIFEGFLVMNSFIDLTSVQSQNAIYVD